MLRMDGFHYHQATDAAHAVALYHAHDDAMYLAGGTDLLPNIKHRIFSPRHLVGLRGALPSGIARVGDTLEIGAGTRLSALAKSTELPALAHAASLVAGPAIRNMGTIGGNVLLDTRCLYYNQTAFWRNALGHCLKADGDWCHVIDGPKTCVATQSSDTVPMLMAMDASIRLLGPDGERVISLRKLFRYNGMDHLTIAPGELLTHVVVPAPSAKHRGAYDKVRTRGAIDFPLVGVAVWAQLSGDTGDTAIAASLDIVVGAINPRPQPLSGLDAFVNQPMDDAWITAVSEWAWKRARPQGSVAGNIDWRRHMVRVTTGRLLRQVRG